MGGDVYSEISHIRNLTNFLFFQIALSRRLSGDWQGQVEITLVAALIAAGSYLSNIRGTKLMPNHPEH